MAGLCDINCLLAFCYDRHIHHPAVLTWLEHQAEMNGLTFTQIPWIWNSTFADIPPADVSPLTSPLSCISARIGRRTGRHGI